MYRSIEDFARDWAQESQSTRKVLRALTDASLEQRVTPEGRSAGRLAWHIAGSVVEIPTTAGITGLHDPGLHDPPPARAAQIADAYERAARELPDALRAQWRDEDLPGEIDMYGERWTRADTLTVLIRHEAHHRGQLTVLMRQAGLVVPGCYGPAREEWAAMGIPAMD